VLPDPLDLRSVRDPEIIRLGEIVRAIRGIEPGDGDHGPLAPLGGVPGGELDGVLVEDLA
jgi:hypothetical protein